MIAVLLGSRRAGRSAWTSRRKSKTLHANGLAEGDELIIYLDGGLDAQTIVEDTVFIIPELVKKIQVEHVRASGNRVFVDLR
jgi:glycerate kinase